MALAPIFGNLTTLILSKVGFATSVVGSFSLVFLECYPCPFAAFQTMHFIMFISVCRMRQSDHTTLTQVTWPAHCNHVAWERFNSILSQH